MIYISQSTEETESFAALLAKRLSPPRTFCLRGELGAGKTAFTRGLARGYGCRGRVSSPTFTIMNIYEGTPPIHHFDLYRLGDEDELFDIGFEPSEDGVVTVVEWFDEYAHLFGDDAVLVAITKEDDNPYIRRLEVTDFSGRELP